MESRRSSFFKKYTNLCHNNEKKPHVVRRILTEEESDNEIDSESDTYVCTLRNPRDEEYSILKPNTDIMEELDTNIGPSYLIHQSEMYTGKDTQESNTSIDQAEGHGQTGTSCVRDILPLQASISRIEYTVHTDTISLGQGMHSLQVTFPQSENHTLPGQSHQLQTSLAHKTYVQDGTSLITKNPEIPFMQPCKKAKIDSMPLQEIDMSMQEINKEAATREMTMSIDNEQKENTSLEQKKEKRKRNSVYQHIDFLSDSEDFVCSSSSCEAYTDSDEVNSTIDKKKRITKTQKRGIKRKETVLDDNEENIDLQKRERKINKRKASSNLKNSGKEYITKTGKVIEEKKVKSSTCTPANCHNNCYEISFEKRQAIFDHYWSLCKERRKDWLISNSKRQETKRKRSYDVSSRRNWTYDYYINEGEGKKKVCLKFILSTLDIKQKFLYNVLSSAIQGSAQEDRRGKHIPANKTSQINIEAVKRYIKELPYLPSHYCRKNSKRFYLPQEFRNLSNLYKLYKEKMISEESTVVGEKVFQNIFREFNLGFHVPRKDKCSKCIRFEKEEEGEEKVAHLKDKNETYERFQVHQKIQEENILCVSFDLQKVLNTPYGQSMLLYYSRKLAVYNLTFYESRTREGYCYSWNETEGKRGANEICTILDQYINMVDDRGSVKHLLLYSDACPGQNKNKVVLAAIHSCLQKCNNISSIQMNYLLPGHTYMPVDSMHSVIERSVANNIIWAPSQWATVFMLARKNPKPYHVQILSHKDFCGWDSVADRYFRGNLTGKISKVRTATFKKSDPQKMVVKYSMAVDSPTEDIPIMGKNVELKKIYKSRLPISHKKYQDLWKLCTMKVIPEIFHNEFQNMSNSMNVQDTLQETDVEDS